MITDLDILSSPVVQAKLYALRGHALHKTAGQVLFGVPEVTLETAVTGIGTKLAYARLRSRQIAEGLAAYEALTQPGHDKTANFFANLRRTAPRAVEAAAPHAAEAATDAAKNLEYAMFTPAGLVRAKGTQGRDMAAQYPELAREFPQHLTDFVPQELPAFQLGGAAAQRASAAPAQDVARKARPTQVMERPELPAMHQLGAEGPSLFTPRGGTAPRQPDVVPGPGPMLFGPPKGTAEAPAMFNLQEMMQRAKQASTGHHAALAAGLGLGGASLGALVDTDDPTRGALAGVAGGLGAGLGGVLGRQAGKTLRENAVARAFPWHRTGRSLEEMLAAAVGDRGVQQAMHKGTQGMHALTGAGALGGGTLLAGGAHALLSDKQASAPLRGQDTPVTTALRDELSPEAQYGDLLSKLDFSLEAAA